MFSANQRRHQDKREGTNFEFLEISRLVVHLNLKRVDLEELGTALRLIFAFGAHGCRM